MTNSITTTAAEQSQAIALQIMSLTQQKMSGDIAMKLIDSAVQSVSGPQDPSTITPEQLQSPIDIKV